MQSTNQCGAGQNGFTILEAMVAAVVLLVGIVAVAKLVPVAVGLDSTNRGDSTSLVIAQREMDALTTQPLTATTFTSPQGLACPAASVCNLGNPAAPNTVVGSPVVMLGNRPFINYNAATVAGYNFDYSDPNDPGQASYDIRWAVITFGNGTSTYGRRFIVGVRKMGANGPLLPVALDSMVEK